MITAEASPGPWARLRRLGAGPFGPTWIAIGLAALSAPFVAATFLLPPLFDPVEDFQPPTLASALLVTFVATLGAAVAGGTIGGLFVRTRPTLGTLIALAVAWPVAVSLVSVAASVVAPTFETAYSCFDACGPSIIGRDPLSGAGTYVVALVVSSLTLVPIAIFVGCLWGAHRLNRSGSTFVAAIVLAFGYGSLHWLSFLAGDQAMVAFACLGLGVSVWATALRT